MEIFSHVPPSLPFECMLTGEVEIGEAKVLVMTPD